MNKTLVIAGIGGVLALLCIGSYIAANNYGADMDAKLNAKYENMENILATGSKKVQEVVQVPAMYRDDFAKVINADMKGRYGDSGSKATFQWLKEHDLNYDSAVYTKVQQVIVGFRNKFENEQSAMIGVKQLYTANLDYAWKGYWLRVAGKPKVGLDKYSIISSDLAIKAFSEKKEEAMELR